MSTKFEMQRFNGNRDYGIWQKRMKAILVQQKAAMAYSGASSLPKEMFDTDKNEITETTYSTIMLYLSDNVLR